MFFLQTEVSVPFFAIDRYWFYSQVLYKFLLFFFNNILIQFYADDDGDDEKKWWWWQEFL